MAVLHDTPEPYLLISSGGGRELEKDNAWIITGLHTFIVS